MFRFVSLILPFLFCVDYVTAYSTLSSAGTRQSMPILQLPITTSTESPSSSSSVLSPVLQQMVDERRLYEMNLGHAMDTLRKDYSKLLTDSLDFSIYSSDVTLVDASNHIHLQGLANYKTAFAFLQTLVKFFYHTSSNTLSGSHVQHRMVYDFARQAIRISWNVQFTPKLSLASSSPSSVSSSAARVYMDGISVYKLDSKTGQIIQHKIEHVVINGSSVVPPQHVFTTLKEVLISTGTGIHTRNNGGGYGIPVGVGGAWGYTTADAIAAAAASGL